jgi:uncharacterized protein YbjT (DUF2867 family)
MTTTLILGATGTVGSELVRLLAERGDAPLAATRKPSGAPGEVALDLATGAGLEAAVAAADSAFLMAPAGRVDQDRLLIPVIDAAAARGLRRVVLMSAMGADADPDGPLRRVELHLEGSGLPWNVIRPNWFMQNFNSYWLHGIRADNRIALPVGDARGSFIDARDIAAVAAALLARDDLANRAFDLTGGEALSHAEVAGILSRETGREIRFEDAPPEALRAELVAAGLSGAYADFLVTILGYFRLGYSERTTDAVETVTGKAPRRFVDYARDYRAAWLD